jgi:hypothetical protein
MGEDGGGIRTHVPRRKGEGRQVHLIVSSVDIGLGEKLVNEAEPTVTCRIVKRSSAILRRRSVGRRRSEAGGR